ncbi:hypothetical protein IFM89_035154 [Coptis chinensis]|uniref:Uncharacterized protein n=1 Tax=Coptis chinensis TaxID=261450 RepID=A0A835IRS1_9MAGN|nr:hypothetical protein IFM89_035154 [Coptis chinensis]
MRTLLLRKHEKRKKERNIKWMNEAKDIAAQKAEEAKQKVAEYKDYVAQKAKKAKDTSAQKAGETTETVKNKASEYTDSAAQKAKEAKDTTAQKAGDEYKDYTAEKAKETKHITAEKAKDEKILLHEHEKCGLTGVEENDKFKKRENPTMGTKSIVDVAKVKYGLKYVYVWHAIIGYWGGIQPGLEEYESSMKFPTVSKGVLMNEPNWKMDPLAVQGLGLVGGFKLTRQYHQALDASVGKNFPDNGIIACKSHNIDSVYYSKQMAIVRTLDDFYPRDPVSHIHPVAEYHASTKAASDPTHDGVSLLKIWNMNKYTGVIGVYNCQGAAWSNVEKKNMFHETQTEALTGAVRGKDVHLISEAATEPDWKGGAGTIGFCNVKVLVFNGTRGSLDCYIASEFQWRKLSGGWSKGKEREFGKIR